MLQYLQIKNLALMDESSLELEPGFTVVTGETGAGKSVLLGALALLCGNRIDKSIIRQNENYCSVEGLFSFTDTRHIDALLDSHGLPICEDGELLIKRIVNRNKAARIHINGAMATLGVLQEIGEYWIDFHGPGEPQKLFHGKYQLSMLDAFAGTKALQLAYNELYQKRLAQRGEFERLQNAEQLSSDEADYIRAQITAIDEVNPSPDRIEKLERDFLRIDAGREITELIDALQDGFVGDNGLVSETAPLIKAADSLASILPEAIEPSQRLEALAIEIDDLANTYAEIASSVDCSQDAQEDIQQSMQAWMELRRKYGQDPEAVLAKRQQFIDQLESQGDIEGSLNQLNEKISLVEKDLRKIAAKLYRERIAAATNLSVAVAEILLNLGFKQAAFEIAVIDDKAITASGGSHCSFQFSPNAGQSVKALNKIASSGETARVMLAIKGVLAKVETTPVLVFDEVDANIGGEIGVEVGRELARLAEGHQVFCVTHLPQVAAYGQRHLLVTKEYKNEQTSVTINSIHHSQEQRENELARMLGNRNSDAAKQHAKELLG